ncbi:hypothetical protein [Ferroplasma sp.]
MQEKQKVTITLDKNTYKIFKEECNKNDIKVSTKINTLIREWLQRRGM